MPPIEKFIAALKTTADEVLIKEQRLQCIDVAAIILEQIHNLASIYDIKNDDVVVKSIPTSNPTEFRHVWIELNGTPIDPDREAKTPAGKEIREIIAQAEENGTIQTNNQGLIRVMGSI